MDELVTILGTTCSKGQVIHVRCICENVVHYLRVWPGVGAGLQPLPQLDDAPPQFPGPDVAGGHLALHPHLGVRQHAGHALQEGQVHVVQLEPGRKAAMVGVCGCV